MNISAVEINIPDAILISITDDSLSVDLSDGRSISAPLEWYPRLLHATPAERNQWRLIGKGHGIHWEKIDEDVSIEGLLAGKPSGESQASLQKWLKQRQNN
ncbi:MAG: DUF2442 domain-containing protein [Thermodesulfobacteriota bacterium]|nr:DUF2442 domain-containing protein [Thermodesulfobacteriota bacterium]